MIVFPYWNRNNLRKSRSWGSLTSWERKCLIYLAGNSSIFKAIFQWAKYTQCTSAHLKLYSNMFLPTRKCIHYMSALCLFSQPHFHLSESDMPLRCNRQFKNSFVKIVFLDSDWISPLLNHAITGHVCWYCLAMWVPDWADWTPTVTVCIQNIYQPHGHKPQTLHHNAVLQQNSSSN